MKISFFLEIDRPPIADAGSNRIIHLPQNFVVLYANNSKDDYGIVGYKWTINSDKKDVAVDMTVRSFNHTRCDYLDTKKATQLNC